MSWWTCTGRWRSAACVAGESAESLATLDRALASPGISAGHRARLLVLAARTHSNLGEVEKAAQVAAERAGGGVGGGRQLGHGLGAADDGALTSARGRMADALPLVDRALAATEAEPALSDLRLLLEINKAVMLGDLDEYEQAFAAAGRSPAAGGPGRHGDPASSGAQRVRRAAVPDRALGRRAGRGGTRAREPEDYPL